MSRRAWHNRAGVVLRAVAATGQSYSVRLPTQGEPEVTIFVRG